jgi:hypothetical protein
MDNINIFICFSIILPHLTDGNNYYKCCDEVLIASSGPGEEYQSDRLGVYKQLENQKFNDKPLYRKVDGDDYLYFWIFEDEDNDYGDNWLVR